MLAPNLPCSSPNLLSLRATAFNFASISITLLFFCINIERILSHSHLLTTMQEHLNSQYHVWTVSTISRRICHSCKIGQMIFISKLPLSNIGRHRSGQSPLKFTIENNLFNTILAYPRCFVYLPCKVGVVA